MDRRSFHRLNDDWSRWGSSARDTASASDGFVFRSVYHLLAIDIADDRRDVDIVALYNFEQILPVHGLLQFRAKQFALWPLLIKSYIFLDCFYGIQNVQEKWKENIPLFIGRTCAKYVVHEEIGQVGDDVCFQKGVDQTIGVGSFAEQLEESSELHKIDIVVAALKSPHHQGMEGAIVDDVQSLALAEEIDLADLDQQLCKHQSELAQVQNEAALQ